MKISNLILGVFTLGLTSCTDCGGDPFMEDDITLFADQLVYIEQDFITPAHENASLLANEMHEAMSVFTVNPNQTTLANARMALKTAWKAFQPVSLLRFGPGEDLIPQINTFPADGAALQTAVETGVYDNPPNDEQGFPAMDWLLNENGMTDEEMLNAFTNGQSGLNRQTILTTCSSEIASRLSTIASSWETGFGSSFVNATGASAGSGMSLFINSFVQDFEALKRTKIALPLGLLTLDIPLPEKVEVYYGGYSVEMALEHLAAVKQAFHGTENRGLKDLLDDFGAYHDATQMNLSDAIITQLEAAESALELVPDPLSTTIDSNPALVQAAYDELQQAVVLLKADLPSALGISITFTDNDGD